VEQRTRLLLEKKYREAANREMAAGRHGRAAYIFAHLLGDWASAANALEKDQRFREAADIHQKKLSNPRRAAVCLEAGGFYREAADFHLLVKDYEKAGDCLEKIGQFEEAVRHFRTAADAQPDRLVKARILEQKLRLPDEAVHVLESGIRSDGQAKRCLQALFQLLRRLDRPDAAHALMQRLEQPANQIPFPLVFVEALLETRKDCLREDTIALANNIVTDTAGRWISQNPHSQDNVALLRLLRQVAPQDVLLKRDCELQDLASRVRHTAQHRAAVAQPKGGLLPESSSPPPQANPSP
jgi:tetratricopeptide (TPR) repeat protein